MINRLIDVSLNNRFIVVALFIGLAAVNLTRPGEGVNLKVDAKEGQEYAKKTQTLGDFLNHVVPDSVFAAAVNNEVLQIVFWSILFGVGLTQVRGRPCPGKGAYRSRAGSHRRARAAATCPLSMKNPGPSFSNGRGRVT